MGIFQPSPPVARGRGRTCENALETLYQEPVEVLDAIGLSGLYLLELICREAPGTFMHSFEVANFVGCLFPDSQIRAAVLLHDIGKLIAPERFAENETVRSPRPPDEIIGGHVYYGLQLARQYDLSPLAEQAIIEHHGTMSISTRMRYPGPRPTATWTGVLMLSDCFQAMSAQNVLNDKNAWQAFFQRRDDGQFSGLPDSLMQQNCMTLLSYGLGEHARRTRRHLRTS